MKTKLSLILALALLAPLLVTPRMNAVCSIPGDINGDNKVNILDVTLAATQYKVTSESSAYNATIVSKADLAPPFNGVIDLLDLVTLIGHFTG